MEVYKQNLAIPGIDPKEMAARNYLPEMAQSSIFDDQLRYKPYPVYHEHYDGERNIGELGYPIDYFADFRNLSIRSWQSFYESDITQLAIKNYLLWVIGNGLTLQSEPMVRMINKMEPNFNRDNFVEDVEMMWKIYTGLKLSSHDQMQDLHSIAWDAQMNAIIGGDVLVVMRYENGIPNIQLIDGVHVYDPFGPGDYFNKAKGRGNEIKNGIEIDSRGRHVAYYVNVEKTDAKFERIVANHSKTDRPMAWLHYGFKYRLNDVRGMPLFAVVLESLKKIDRYKDAELSGAEQRAKVAYFIEHGINSDGEDIFDKAIEQTMQIAQDDGEVPESSRFEGDAAATQIAGTTGGQAFNMPLDTTIKSIASDRENNFKDFFTINFDVICASLGIPPEVALGKYNSNYSASRMAVKTWEHRVGVDRNRVSKGFYKPIYSFWLDMEILKQNINAPGYILSRSRKNYMMKYAYLNCDFHGVNMPHVDPLKEVMAERKKVGNDKIPLTTYSKATRNLNEGDFEQNLSQARNEMEKAKDFLPEPEPAPQNINKNGN